MKRNRKNWQCYRCGAPAVSKEHVPPICLFPEEKDIRTSIFRNNLITVPSCELHNSRKSKDDEFLMASITGLLGNNVIGYFHNMTKVKRAIERNAPLAGLLSPRKNQTQNNAIQIEVNQGNFKRLQSCFEHIAYGLYLHKFGHRFEGKCRCLIDFLSYDDPVTENYKMLCRKRWEHEPSKLVTEGANPEIFRYSFVAPDEHGLIALKLSFYEGAHVYVVFVPESAQLPTNLMGALIEKGIKTRVNFSDNSVIEFN